MASRIQPEQLKMRAPSRDLQPRETYVDRHMHVSFHMGGEMGADLKTYNATFSSSLNPLLGDWMYEKCSLN